ncbi:MAG: 7-cyano-7-deazaguanine synthase [Chloroflexota bacterium]|nr:7-cyano-7-deazaguanine synthase [Chloroflexota bacterium]MDE2969252.1 7-cyano-7-deazaguanine synthase [Chloroflexota bacterium]
MPDEVAALASGGLDSCILVADMAEDAIVTPIYVRKGLAWEDAEHAALVAFVRALGSPNVRPVTTLSVPVRQVYGRHWSVTGENVPGYHAPDEAVFIPGRNVLLLGLTAVWCSTHGVSRIAIGTLGGNPFPDATPSFFESYASVLSQGLGHRVIVEAPYRGGSKAQLIRTHSHLPLELSLTCVAPSEGQHCGDCNKCRERQEAFVEAGVPDKTPYAKE